MVALRRIGGFFSRRRSLSRSGSAAMLLIGAAVVVCAVLAVIWLVMRRANANAADAPLTEAVTRGPFEHIVLEQGEVESSSNIELKCEVKCRTQGGGPSTSIIWVIDEGAHVQKGDLLVTLDSSALESEKVQQTINVNTSKALLSQAEGAVKTAEITLEEYLNGVYKQEEKTILNEIFVAEEALKKAQLSYDSIKRLVSRGVLAPLQLEGEKFKLDNAKNQLDLAQGKLRALEDFTKEKMVVGYRAEIEAARANYDAALSSYEEELNKLKDINQQIEKCKIYAPLAGQVVHANLTNRRGGAAEFVVEPGGMVREQQTLIRLPDATKMQVKATINESRIALVKEGMPVAIQIGAFEGRELEGRVTKVSTYAEPSSWFSSQVKEYATFIEILDPPKDIRTGMTAEVRIFVEQLDEALQVPVQAIHDHKGRFFCLVQKGDGWETREVAIGSSNEKYVTIDKGLAENERVILNPRRHMDKFELPDLPDAPAAQVARGSPVGAKPQLSADGPESQASASEVNKVFASLDKDGDGKISSEELQDAPADRSSRLAAADRDGDGAIDRAEFSGALNGPPPKRGATQQPSGGGA